MSTLVPLAKASAASWTIIRKMFFAWLGKLEDRLGEGHRTLL